MCIKPIGKMLLTLLATFAISSCSSSPDSKGPWNSADDQRANAEKTQDELSRETK